MKQSLPIAYVLLFMGLMAAPVHAADSADTTSTAATLPAEAKSYGGAAEAWLELQRSGQAASPNKQTLSGPAMKKIHDNYLDEFSRPVPDMAVEHAKDSR